MEQLKVKKKDVLVMNSILFLGLSFIFLYLQYAYRHHLSPFSAAYLRKSLELFWYVSLPLILASVLVWKHHRFSRPVFIFCATLISYKVIEGIFIEFNKIIVITLFFYIVIAYFFYQLLDSYQSMASLNANYSPSDLFEPLLRKIPCTLGPTGTEYHGYLTNWDEEGCFIKIENGKVDLAPEYKIIISFKGRNFEQAGELIAHSMDFTGLGIKFQKTLKGLETFNWSEFIELIQELGYKPERLR